MPIFYRILSKSQNYIILFVFIHYIFLVFFFNFLWSIFKFQCYAPYTDIIVIIHFIMLGFAIFLLFLLIIYDIIHNLNIFLKCKFKEYFIINDPFYMRIELCLLTTFLIVYIPWAFPISQTIRGILTDVTLFIYISAFCLFPLCATIVREINGYFHKRKRLDENASDTLDMIFRSTVFLTLFEEFAKNEFSSENVRFRIEYENYLNTHQSKRDVLVGRIIENYLCGTSPFQLNIDSKNMKLFKEKYSKSYQTGEFEDNLFLEIEKAVNLNLADTFSRFCVSIQYITKVNQMELLGKSFTK